ncbi:hypothetical protein ElyMa_003168800 [Elysia marginata]|uniref:Uncharacterized protein n=1 Tax=Elysia marginata TaxID=1093978 RepID=A0AAV4IX31_9GAST|nr:hypothetical protein ElyMa_003168800 [Elysia marginata]
MLSPPRLAMDLTHLRLVNLSAMLTVRDHMTMVRHAWHSDNLVSVDWSLQLPSLTGRELDKTDNPARSISTAPGITLQDVFCVQASGAGPRSTDLTLTAS